MTVKLRQCKEKCSLARQTQQKSWPTEEFNSNGDQNRPEDLHKSDITEQVLRERRQLA